MDISLSQALAFDSVPGAIGYTVELLHAARGDVLRTFSLNAATLTLPATTLLANRPFGNYLVRVRAELDGIAGRWSPNLDLFFGTPLAPASLRVI